MPNFNEPSWAKTVEEYISKEQAMQEKLETPAVSSVTLAALKILFLDPNANVAEIAKIITSEIKKHIEETDSCAVSYKFWAALATAIQHLGYVDKIVQLFVEIARIPMWAGEEEGDESYGYGDFLTPYWEVWSEFFNGFDDPISTDPEREAKRQGWINFNLFNAEISRYRREYPRLDQRTRVQWLQYILEKSPWEEDYDRAKYATEDPDERYLLWQKEAHNVKTLDGYVPAAAVWFTTDAQAIYEMKGDVGYEKYDFNKTDWHKKEGGKDGYSRERFIYWRKRFEWISGVEELEEKTRVAAKEATEAMKRVEEANQID